MHTDVNEQARSYLSVAEVAADLGVSAATVRRKIATGEIPACQLGGPGSSVRVPQAAVKAWLYSEGPAMSPVAKRGKPKQTEIYQCWLASIDGHTIAQGERLRGNHPAVLQNPSYFVPDGTSPDQVPDPFADLNGRAERDDPPAETDMNLPTAPVAYEPPELVRLKALRAGVGTDSRGYPAEVVEFAAGTLFDRASLPGDGDGEFFERVRDGRGLRKT